MQENVYNTRIFIIGGIMVLIVLIYIGKLFTLQVAENEYKTSASSNVLRYVTQYPVRGLMYDRNNELMVYNEAAYDIMVIPKQLNAFDTAELCEILDIEKSYAVDRLKKAKTYSHYKPSIFLKQVSARRYAILQEKMYECAVFFVQTRTLRKYPD